MEYFEAFAGIAAAGLITVNLNWRLSVPELTRIVADAEPDVLMFDGPGQAARTGRNRTRNWSGRRQPPARR